MRALKTSLRVSREYSDKVSRLHYLEQPNQVATFAFALIERFGLIAADADGEDSAGRQKGFLLPVADVVDRAFGLAEKAYEMAFSRGMMLELPDPNVVNAEATADADADA